ncbi:uncharacterized protein LOC142973379 [Anticarsia gemmatalis]|uniref:uncharacterized protein LOC142973379 n=1 Tax=Anticarsia gemmatalis TaxID=129554 RepID=UPI003F771FC0
MQFDETRPFNPPPYFIYVFIAFLIMDFIYFKMMLIVNSWLLAGGSPVAMLQHATSSQSIVFHQLQASPAMSPVTTESPIVSNSGNHPKYEYKYEVSDHQTGDRKSHWERRDGDNVRGVYTLYEPDGALRTVEYTADALHGFNAVVRRNEPNTHQHQHQHPRLNSGYKQAASSSSGRDGYDDSSRSYSSERDIFTNKPSPRRQGKLTSYNQGVDFSVVHGHNAK